MPWRPSNLTDLTRKDAAHVVNQLFRETNGRIDDIQKAQVPVLRGQATLTFGSIAAGSCVDRTFTLLGARQDNVPHATPTLSIGNNLHWATRITASDKVTIRVCNVSGGAVTPQAVQWKVIVQ